MPSLAARLFSRSAASTPAGVAAQKLLDDHVRHPDLQPHRQPREPPGLVR
jgi:hypothetical protein